MNNLAHDAEAGVDGLWRRRDGKDKEKVVSISAEVVVWSSYFLERRHCRDGLLTAPHARSFGRSTELIQIPAPKDYHDGKNVFAALLDLPGGVNERRVLFLWSGT